MILPMNFRLSSPRNRRALHRTATVTRAGATKAIVKTTR
jgi:hypothetical protein